MTSPARPSPPLSPRTARPLASLAVLSLLWVGACLHDAPIAPLGGRVSLRVSLQTGSIGQSVRVHVFFFTPRSEARISLLDQTFALQNGEQQLAVSFDLAPCLSAFAPDDSGPYCDVGLELELVQSGVMQDHRTIGPIRVRPGGAVQAPRVLLVAGNTPPVAGIDTAVLVNLDLVKYRVSSSDKDGDLLALTASVFDSSGSLLEETPVISPDPLLALHAERFAFVPPSARVQELHVVAVDSKGNMSAPATHAVEGAASGLLGVLGMRTDTTADSVHVLFRMFDQSGTADSVEVVFRNVVPDGGGADTLYFVCAGRFVPDDSGRSRIGCGRPVRFTQAVAILLPVTPKGDWGPGFSCGVPADCLTPFGFRRAALRPAWR